MKQHLLEMYRIGSTLVKVPYKVIRRMTYFLSNLSPEVIKWPTDAEKVKIENYFGNRNFPGIVGIIDATHIKIGKTADDPDSYLNRKHFHSI